MPDEIEDRCPDCDHSLWDCVCWLAAAQAATELHQRHGSTFCSGCVLPVSRQRQRAPHRRQKSRRRIVMSPDTPSTSTWVAPPFFEHLGRMFGLCVWVHSLLTYMLVLQAGSNTDRAAFAAGQSPSDKFVDIRVHWHKQDLRKVIHKFRTLYGENLTPIEKQALETLQETRNTLAHCYFTLSDRNRVDPFVIYIPKAPEGEEIVHLFKLNDAALLELESALKPLTVWCQQWAAAEWGITLPTLP